jgi:hypothetical protein
MTVTVIEFRVDMNAKDERAVINGIARDLHDAKIRIVGIKVRNENSLEPKKPKICDECGIDHEKEFDETDNDEYEEDEDQTAHESPDEDEEDESPYASFIREAHLLAMERSEEDTLRLIAKINARNAYDKAAIDRFKREMLKTDRERWRNKYYVNFRGALRTMLYGSAGLNLSEQSKDYQMLKGIFSSTYYSIKSINKVKCYLEQEINKYSLFVRICEEYLNRIDREEKDER